MQTAFRNSKGCLCLKTIVAGSYKTSRNELIS